MTTEQGDINNYNNEESHSEKYNDSDTYYNVAHTSNKNFSIGWPANWQQFTSDSLSEILRKIHDENDHLALFEFVRRYWAVSYSYCKRPISSVFNSMECELAEEAAQDGFLSLINGIQSGRITCISKNLVLNIMKKRAIDKIRAEIGRKAQRSALLRDAVHLDELIYSSDGSEMNLGDVIEDESVDIELELENRDRVKMAYNLSFELPKKMGSAFRLYYFNSLTMREIGAVLHICESRVCQLLRDARKILRKRVAILN